MSKESESIAFEETVRTNFVFKTEWWEIADGGYKTNAEKFTFLKTIMDFGAHGIIPPNCTKKELIKTDDDRIKWSALRLCMDYIQKHDKMAKGGSKGMSTRWRGDGDSVAGDSKIYNDVILEDRHVADVNAETIDPHANIRCNDVTELKLWFDRFKKNSKMIKLDRFEGTNEEWNGLFEYLNNNTWKINKGTQYIIWSNFEKAVRWAWTNVRDKMEEMKSRTQQNRKEERIERPGDDLKREAELRKITEAAFIHN